MREKAKQLVELLNDTARIREEREKARALRDKYVGIAGDDRFGGTWVRYGCRCVAPTLACIVRVFVITAACDVRQLCRLRVIGGLQCLRLHWWIR